MSGSREITCISCPMGCRLRVSVQNDTIKVTGNQCARGVRYGEAEYTYPVRMVTTVMRARSGRPVPVRLSKEAPKSAIPEVLREIARVTAPAGVKRHEVLIENVAGTGSDVIATADGDGG